MLNVVLLMVMLILNYDAKYITENKILMIAKNDLSLKMFDAVALTLMTHFLMTFPIMTFVMII
jgi:hypothetical protein